MEILKWVAQMTWNRDNRMIDDRFTKGHEFIKDQPLNPQEVAIHSHGDALQVQLWLMNLQTWLREKLMKLEFEILFHLNSRALQHMYLSV